MTNSGVHTVDRRRLPASTAHELPKSAGSSTGLPPDVTKSSARRTGRHYYTAYETRLLSRCRRVMRRLQLRFDCDLNRSRIAVVTVTALLLHLAFHPHGVEK